MAQKHVINFASGYSLALAISDRDIGFGKNISDFQPGQDLMFEDITPKFGQGLNLSLGYEFSISNHWSLWADFLYLRSIGYSSIDTISVWQLDNELYDHYGGIRETEFNSRNYAIRAGVAFSLNRNLSLPRSRSQERFYHQLKIGVTYNKPSLTALSTAYQYLGQLDSVHYETYTKGTGWGATMALKSVYKLSQNWEVFLQVGADCFPYTPKTVFYRSKYWNGEDELNPGAGGFIPNWMGGDERDLHRSAEFPFHNISVLVGANYILESKRGQRPRVSPKKHVVNIASGYSVALETSDSDVGFGRTLKNYMYGGPQVFEDVTPKFGQGLNIVLGYEYFLNDAWSLWSDLSLLRSAGYSTMDTPSVWQLNVERYKDVRNTDFEATKYSAGGGIAFNINRDKTFRKYDIPSRFYYQVKTGLHYSLANLRAISTTKNFRSQPDSVNYDTFTTAKGLGATLAFKASYKISPTWHLYLHVGGEWFEVQPAKMEYRFKVSDGSDELLQSIGY